LNPGPVISALFETSLKTASTMDNYPNVLLGLVAVSRGCFPMELARKRRDEVARYCRERQVPISVVDTVVETEDDAISALEEMRGAGINALAVYLGNFGPEGPETLLAARFPGPVMFAGAAEQRAADLMTDRGDAYCGMLNASYNLGLRNLRPHIPERPIGTPDEICTLLAEFIPIAGILIGLKQLKVFSFGPRPQDFLACNAPIKPLYDLGVEIMENSELDLYEAFLDAKGDPMTGEVAEAMAAEPGVRHCHPEALPAMAQYEVALLRFLGKNLGGSRFAVFANKCWPAFERFFGFVPCYVNSRLTMRGIPVACEVDIYGALSEYAAMCASGLPPTLLDINNTVPEDMYQKGEKALGDYRPSDLFMGFHCGNTPSCLLMDPEVTHHKIMYRLLEDGKAPDITRGTIEGRIKGGPVTLFRLQSTADARLQAYAVQGEVVDLDPESFGSIGVIGVREMARFYRHVLIEKRFPHHAAAAFAHVGRRLFYALRMLGIADLSYNRREGDLYPTESPF
jgi:L-fucose isomerase-like protein